MACTSLSLHVFHHLGYTTGADACAESAPDAFALIHHVFVGLVGQLNTGDGAVVAALNAHAAVAAGAAGHAAVRFLPGRELDVRAADLVILGLDPLIGD